MGTGQALREAQPGGQDHRRRAAPGRRRDGPALARGRLHAGDPRRLEARPPRCSSPTPRRSSACARCSTRRASGRASPPVPWSRSAAASPPSMDPDQNVVCLLADGGWKYASAGLWSRDADELEERHGGPALVVADAPLQLPRAMADEIVAHARAGLPNEACGIVSGVDATATRFHPAVNGDASPFRYSIDVAGPAADRHRHRRRRGGPARDLPLAHALAGVSVAHRRRPGVLARRGLPDRVAGERSARPEGVHDPRGPDREARARAHVSSSASRSISS